MKDEVNMIAQLYKRIESCFESKRIDEYFCMVYKSRGIEMTKDDPTILQEIEDDRLTNIFCAPYQVVYQVMPTSLATRFGFLLSNYFCFPQILHESYETWIYESERSYIKKLKEQLCKYEETTLEKEHKVNWKEAFDGVYRITKQLVKVLQTNENVKEAYGERELFEARRRLQDSCKRLPDHMQTYPVILHPRNWRESLTSSFQPLELVPSLFEAIHQFMELLDCREYYMKQLFYFVSEVEGLKQIQVCYQAYLQKVSHAMHFSCDKHDQHVLACIVHVLPKDTNISMYQTLNQILHKKQPSNVLREFFKAVHPLQINNQEIQEMILKISTDNAIVLNLVKKIKSFDSAYQQVCLNISIASQKRSCKEHEETMIPKEIPKEYESIVLNGSVADFASSSMQCENGIKTNLHALFGVSVPYGLKEEQLKKVYIQIGCLVTQVDIQRPWMMEEIFDFTSAYIRLSKQKASSGSTSLKHKKQDLLPSYPKRMVIAKDVTIRFDFQKAKDMLNIVKKHASLGNGFLCFQDDRKSCVPCIDENNTILTLRYPKAYVLGYFMRYTPKDLSIYEQGGNQYAREK